MNRLQELISFSETLSEDSLTELLNYAQYLQFKNEHPEFLQKSSFPDQTKTSSVPLGIRPIRIALKPEASIVIIEDQSIFLSDNEFLIYWLFATFRKKKISPIRSINEFLEELKAFAQSVSSRTMPSIATHNRFADATQESIMKSLTHLKAILEQRINPLQHQQCCPMYENGVFMILADPMLIECPPGY